MSNLIQLENNEFLDMKPIFIPKNKRQQIALNNKIEFSTNSACPEQPKIKEQNIEYIIDLEKNLEKKSKIDEQENKILCDDTDYIDSQCEYEKWKIRELNRIKRNLLEKVNNLNQKTEIYKGQDNEKITFNSAPNKEKNEKINFLQQYYHKGVFFQNEADNNENHIYNRNYNLPTWEDTVDRTGLPEILMKRRGKLFKKGQTKYTHLSNEDTTNFNPFYKVPEALNKKNVN